MSRLNKNEAFNFCLTPLLYAAKCDSGIILLDLANDTYLSLKDEAAASLELILTNSFRYKDNNYLPINFNTPIDSNELNTWLTYFIEKKYIQIISKKFDYKILSATLPGGLVDYEWNRKDIIPSSKKISKALILKSILTLLQVSVILHFSGIRGIINQIKKYKEQPLKAPSSKELSQLSGVLDIAVSIFPKKIYCLAWSSAFVLMALKRGWKCSLVIGVQSPPFYAHAWAESNNQVINDSPIIQKQLAVLVKEPLG